MPRSELLKLWLSRVDLLVAIAIGCQQIQLVQQFVDFGFRAVGIALQVLSPIGDWEAFQHSHPSIRLDAGLLAMMTNVEERKPEPVTALPATNGWKRK